MQPIRQLFDNAGRCDLLKNSRFLRREISRRMMERLALITLVPQRLLDAGCGEGEDLLALHHHFPSAQILGLDAAWSLLTVARRRHLSQRSWWSRFLPKRHDQAGHVICGDFSQPPFAPNTIDMIWSNLALHWHSQPEKVFSAWYSLLRGDGLLMFSCFGPDTFKECRAAFASMDQAPHAMSFVDMHDLGDHLLHAGFSTPVMEMEMITVTYDDREQCWSDLRAWGINPSVMDLGFIKRNAAGKLTLTYEIIYGHAFRQKNPRPEVQAIRWDLGKNKAHIHI